MDSIKVTRDQWELIVDAARQHTGDPELPLWSALVNYYNVCMPSLITELSFKLWNLYRRINGTKNETHSSYYALPAFWVDACDVIERETTRIDRIRANKAKREQREILRHTGNSHGNK